MTEEKADQIIRCVKECWWQVIILLLVGIGMPVVLFHGWPTDGWALGWDAFAAVGAFLAAVAAFFAANVALKIAQDDRVIRAESDKKQMLIYQPICVGELITIKSAFREYKDVLERYKFLPLGSSLLAQTCVGLNTVTNEMTQPFLSQRVHELHLFGVEVGGAIANIISFIPHCESCTRVLVRPNALVDNSSKKLASDTVKGLNWVLKEFDRIEWLK